MVSILLTARPRPPVLRSRMPWAKSKGFLLYFLSFRPTSRNPVL